jgi:uncharacterized Zn finger protein
MKRKEILKKLRNMKRLADIVIKKIEDVEKSWIKMHEIGEELYNDGLLMIDDGDVIFNAFRCAEDIQIDLGHLEDIKVAIRDSINNIKDLDSIGGEKI